MKAQILLCVLILSAAPLSAQEAVPFGTPPAQAAPFGTHPVQTFPGTPAMTAAAPPATGTETFTSPPIVVDPNGTGVTSQYQPGAVAPLQPGMPAPIVPYGSPMPGPGCGSCGGPCGSPCGPQSGLINPGLVEPAFPYSSLTPDVTMVPTTPNGPMPNRNGWTQRYEMGFMPESNASGPAGHFQSTEFDLDWKYIAPVFPYPAIFSFTQQYDLRLWSGPGSTPTAPVSLPGAVHRIGWDFELKSESGTPWNAVVGFNPSINSDFQGAITSDAWNWDGRAALLLTPSRDLTYVFGVLFWDRVHERILPWAGVIYRPSQYWQFDLVFPQLRVATYLWDEWGFRTTLYARLEYHSEAYQIDNTVLGQRERVEVDDYRAMVGFNKDRGDFDYFLEGGWIFGRSFTFKNDNENFSVDSGAIVRGGVRF